MDEEEQTFWVNALEEFSQLQESLRNAGYSIPFDASRLVSPNPMVYDYARGWGEGEHVGYYAVVKGGPVRDLLGNVEEAPDDICLIVSHANGRVVVFSEATESYFGWINPDEYQIIDVYFPESQPWMH